MANSSIKNQNDTRNYGIDLLKIISMIMIIVLHITGQGGMLENTVTLSSQYNILWLLRAMCFCCVNCYALATGYLMYQRKVKYSNIIYLYLQVVFYMAVISVIYFSINPDLITFKSFVDILFPFAHDGYWYFTAYFGMFFFIPYLNILIEKLSKKQGAKLILSIIFIFTILPLIFDSDIFKMDSGYSMFWLISMYLFGAYFKKYNFKIKLKKRTGFLIYMISVLTAFGIRTLFIFAKTNTDFIKLNGTYIINYCSPFILLSSIGLLIFFSQVKLKGTGKSIIRFLVPLSFGVYLIHVNPFIWESAKGIFSDFASLNLFLMTVYILIFTLLIYLSCALLDSIRLSLFKVIKVKQFSEKLSNIISFKINKLIKL